jgi:hypothetical protein
MMPPMRRDIADELLRGAAVAADEVPHGRVRRALPIELHARQQHAFGEHVGHVDDHPLLRKSQVDPVDLRDEPMILGDMAECGE